MNDGTTPSTIEPSPPSPSQSPTPEPQSPATLPETDDIGFSSGEDGLDEASIFADLDETPPAKTPPAPAQPTQQPTTAPQPTQPQEPTPQAGTPEPQVTPEQVAESFRNWRSQAEHVLSNAHYNLSAEDAAQMNVDPGQVIPKLMSRVYLDAVTAAVNVIAQALPYTVMNTIDAHNGYKKNEDEFFSEWPGLKDHGPDVVRVGQVFRHLNPRASKEDFIRSVGAQVTLALGLTAEQARGTRPSAPNVAGQRMLRHVPPAASARHMATPPRTPANIFEQMAQDTAEDD